MVTAPISPVVRFVRRLASVHLATASPDDQLLQRYAVERDQDAFAVLVRRHGPLVLGVCSRVLNDWHAAQDAFQATFLVLARKAGSLHRPESLGPWLYGVACRTALKARGKAARRLVCEQRAAVAEAVDQPNDPLWRDLRPMLDEAVAQLPEKYRIAFVLHHLEGLTVAEVARRLGCPQGTIAARLARAKERLRTQLVRKGIALSAAAMAAALSQGTASSAAAWSLAGGAVDAATAVAASKAIGIASGSMVALTKGVLQAMSLMKLKIAAGLFLAMGAVGVGLGLSSRETQDGSRTRDRTCHASDGCAAKETRSTTGLVAATAAPTAERFYAGGFRTLRGFEFLGVGAEKTRVTPDINCCSSCEREYRVMMRSAEQEYRVSTTTDSTYYLVHFVDGGTVESPVNTKDYRVSAGEGLRFVVPMLGPTPIPLDFGFPIIEERKDREQVFSFWIGFFG
jgi:RNA polymerase sigma factor (sigma-70 family)